MTRHLRIFLLVGTVLSLLTILRQRAYRTAKSSASSATAVEIQPVEQDWQAWTTAPVAGPRFSSYEITVVEKSTGKPIKGAVVRTNCLGGTPYERQAVKTDKYGKAKVFFFARAQLVFASVGIPGAATQYTVVGTNDLVIRF